MKLKHQILIAILIPVVINLAIVGFAYYGLETDANSAGLRSTVLFGTILGVAVAAGAAFFVSSRLSDAINQSATSINNTADEIAATVDRRVQTIRRRHLTSSAGRHLSVALADIARLTRRLQIRRIQPSTTLADSSNVIDLRSDDPTPRALDLTPPTITGEDQLPDRLPLGAGVLGLRT